MSGIHSIQLFDKPPAYPHICAKCGSGSGREHYIDIGLDAEYLEEQQGQPHIKDGVIYLCNMCITDLISQYLFKLFDFVNGQKQAYTHEALNKMNDLDTLHNEIYSLREIIDRQSLEIRTLQMAELPEITSENVDTTANNLIENLLGSDGNGPDNGSNAVNSDSAESSESSDGNDPGVKSDDSGLEIKLGSGILGGTLSIPT